MPMLHSKLIRIFSVKAFSFAFLLLILSSFFNYTNAQTTLAGWDVNGLSGGTNLFGTSPYAATTTAANVTIGGLTRGSGVSTTGSAAARAWGGVNWQATSEAGAISINEFVTFTVTPNAGYVTSINNLTLSYRRSGTGPSTGELQYSTDGITYTDAASISYSSTSSSGATLAPIDLSGITALQNINSATTITFRIVNWGGTSTSGTWYVFDVANSTAPDLVLAGTVVLCPGLITGTGTVCTGSTTTLSDTSAGGTWTSGNTSIATVGSTGIVTGVAAGTATISYTTGCGTTTSIVTVNPVLTTPSSITGTLNVCVGSTTSLSDATTGGIWSSTATGTATVGSTGIITGVAAGTTTISYTTTNSCGSAFAVAALTVNTTPSAPATITGTMNVCVSSTTALGNSTTGGVWSTSDGTTATVGSTGIVTGVATGTPIISYTVANSCGSTYTTTMVTVNPLPATPAAITGTLNVCVGSATTLNNTTTGGVWSSSNTNATVGSGTGIVTGATAGTSTISYTMSNGCGSISATTLVTINPLPTTPGAITGTLNVCAGSNTTLSDTTGGGVWSSTSGTIASIGTSGIVTGVASGNTTISYTITNGCGSAAATAVVTVNPLPAAGTISGSSSVVTSASTTLTDATSGGVWTSTNTSIATVGSTGVLTGVAVGSSVISYTVTNSCGTSAATLTISVVTPSFTRGNLVVLRSGDGSAALSSAATAVFAVEYTTSGSATGFSVALPTTTVSGVPPITISGSASSEGQMTMSAERDRLILEGYNGVAGTSSIVNTTASANAREIFAINSSGNYSLGASSNTAYSANNIRSATASGTNYFSAGTASSAPNGIVYLNSNTTLATTPTNTRVVQIFNGQTYFSASSSPFLGVAKMGTGIPTTSGQTATQLNSSNDGSSYGFSISPDGTTLYIADDAAGILKYTGSGTSYTLTYTVNATPARGLVVDYSGSSPVIYATTTASSANTIIKITDVGAFSSASTIATAATNTGFRGLQFSPSCFASITSLSSSAICSGTGTSLVIKGNPTATVSYNINGGSTLTTTIGNNGQDTLSTGTLTANTTYNLLSITTTACSSVTLSGSATVMVNPLPSAISGTTSICTSGTTTLGNTYTGGTWTSGNTSVATVGSVTGIVSGITTGTAAITYTLACGSTNTTVTVNTIPSAPSAITGTFNVCPSATITLSDATTGGTWSSTSSNATIGSTGIVTGVTAGTTTISYTSTNTCGSTTATAIVTVNALPSSPTIITGVMNVCVGSTTMLDNSTPAGVWSSAATGIATVGTSGNVSGVTVGSVTISYTTSNTCGSASVIANVTVNTVPAAPAAISGPANVCIGNNIILTDTTSGGVWSSASTGVATVGTDGVVAGSSAGIAIISYTVSNTCGNTAAMVPVTVNSLPSAIAGTASACVGASTTLTDGGSGTWSSSDITKATVGTSTGIVMGVAYGQPVITYTLPTGCIITKTVTINATSAGIIAGPAALCNGGNAPLTDSVAGGTWSSNNTSIVTIGTLSGIATGVALGKDTIVYSLTNVCGSYSATMPVTVNIAPPSFTITPALASLCPSSPAQLLTAIGDTITGSVTATNSSTTFTELLNAADTSSIFISAVPAGATITGVAVSFTVSAKSSGEQRDNIYNLRAPNGHIITLDNGKGSSTSGVGFNNVTISSAGTVALSTATMTTGTQYIATLTTGIPTAIASQYRSTDAVWANLYSVPNGAWTFITDNSYNATEDTLKSWSITINYAFNPTVTWSSTTGLFTNSAATTGYTGSTAASVFALPSATTSYVATATLGGCTKTAIVPVNVGSTLYVPSISGSSALCPAATLNLSDSTTGGTWTSGTPAVATIGSSTGLVSGVGSGATNITYTYNSGSCTGSSVKTITVNTLPAVAGIIGTTSLCLSGAPTSTLTDATTGGTNGWSSSNNAVATVGSSTGVVTAIATGSSVISYTYNNGICANMVTTAVTVGNTPTPVVVSPLLASLCSSSPAQILTASGGIVPGATTVSSGAVSVAFTNTAGGSTTPLTVSGIPAGATVTGIAVTYNATESFDGDFELNLEAPNASVINIFSSGTSNNGPNFVNTTISSAGTTAIPNSGSGAPWTGVWAANESVSTTVGSSTLPPTTATWAPLEAANPNGVWTLIGRTNFSGNTATLTSWSITISYNYQSPVTWSSVTGLFTNSGATATYTGTTTDTVYAKPTITTTYAATATNGGCTSASNVKVNVGTSLYVPVISGTASVCVGLTDTLSDSVASGIWTSSNTSLAIVGSATGVVTAVAAGNPVITYTYNSGSCTGFATKTLTVNALPVVAAIAGPGTVCSGAAITLTNATSGGVWSSGTPAVATIGSTGIVSPVSIGSTAISYTFSNGICANVATTTVNSLNTPASVSVSPSSVVTCSAGPAAQFNATGGSIAGSVTFSTSTPQTFGPGTAGVSPIIVSGIPSGATVTGVSINFNASQFSGAWDADDIYNVQAPNGHILNLVTLKGGSGSSPGFVNTTISSTGTTPIPATGAPYTGTFAADTVLGTGATGYPSDSTTWSSLYSTGSPNGTWNLVGGYIFTSGTTTTNSWSVTINYTTPASYTWSSLMGLYTNSGATTAYTGTNAATVYGMPSSLTVYTVTAANGACTSTATTIVSVNPSPVAVAGTPNVCVGSSTTLTDITTPGVWSSSNTSLATIGSATGYVNGIASGIPLVTYTLPTGCYVTMPFTVNALPSAISGPSNICAATSVTFTDASTGGVWSSNNTSIATAGSASGLISGISAGGSVISYTLPTGCAVNMPLTVNSLPSPITGLSLFCTGINNTLSDPTGGGSWSSSNTSIAAIGTITGVVNSIAAGTATISYTLSGGCNITLPITVNSSPSSITGGTNICLGAPASLFDVTSGGTWISGNTSLATIGSTGTLTGISAGTVLISYTMPSGCQATTNVTVNALPTVYSLIGGGSYCVGGSGPHIGLNGSTAGVSYQLYMGTSPVGGPVAGTGSVIDFGAEPAIGTYTAIATNLTASCTSAMSGSISVTTNPVPAGFSVFGSGALCLGGSGIHVGISGSTAGVSYQLYNFSTLIGSPVIGLGTTIDFGAQTAAGSYNVIATITATGCTTTMPGTAVITVNPLPAAYIVSGGGSYCLGGSGVHVFINNSATGVNYQLFNSTAPVGIAVAGTGGVLDLGLQTASGTYTVVGTNTTTGCVGSMAGSTTITTNPLPAAFIVTGGGGYCAGGTGTAIGLANSVSGVSYQLYLAGSAVGSPIAGSTGYSLNFGLQTTAGSYSILATNTTTGCTNSMTGTALVSVNGLPAAYTVTGGGAYCTGGTGVGIALNASQTGVSYQLYNGSSATGSAVTGTGAAISFGSAFTSVGSYTAVATNTTTGCSSNMTGSVYVSVNPLPTAFVISSSATSYCAGGSGVDVTLGGSVPGINYYLYNGGSIVNARTGTGVALDFGIEFAGGTYTAVATSTVTGCSATMTGSASITVNPLPNPFTVTGGGSYCTGTTAPAVGLSSSNNGVNYQLYLAGVATGAAVPGTGAGISFGTQSASGAYTVVATSSFGCVNNMTGSVVVNIIALPTVYPVTGGGAYCAGGTGTHVRLGGSDIGVAYQLYNGSAVGAPVTGTGSVLDFGLETATGTYTVIATNSSTTCTNNMFGSAVISTSALPVSYLVTGGGNYCPAGTGVLVGLGNSATGVNYQLYQASVATGTPVPGTGSSISFGLQTLPATYTVIATNTTTGCTNSMLSTTVVGISALPAPFTMTGGGIYCATRTGVHVGLSGSASGISYQLYNGTAIVTGAAITGTGSALDFGVETATGIYTIRATDPSTTCTATMGGAAAVNTNPIPVVYNMNGGGNYCSGSTGLHVGTTGSGTGIAYQLFVGASPLGSPLSGTGAPLDFGLQTITGNYSVIATNSISGCADTMAGVATVNTIVLPAFHNVTGGGNYCPTGIGVHIGLDSTNTGITYQLYNGTVASGTSVTGTGHSIDFGLRTTTGVYTVTATSSATGCTNNMSGSATVGIGILPAPFILTGGGSYCSGGAGVHVGITGSQSGIAYQLYNGSTPVGLPIAGTSFAIDFGTEAITGTYTVIAQNTITTCSSNMTGSVVVNTNALPSAHHVVGGGSYCAGGVGVHIGLDASDAGVSYQLYSSSVPAGAAIAGTGSALDFGLQTAAGTYTVIGTNTGTSCTNTMSGSPVVIINALPAIYATAGGGHYCAGGTGSNISLGRSDVGVNYQLYIGTTAVGSPVAGTGSLLNFGLQTGIGAYKVVAINNTTTCTSTMTGSPVITIDPLPTNYAVTGGGSYCAGGTGVHVTMAGSGTGINYQLHYGGSSLGAPVAGTGFGLDFGLQTNAGNYTVVATNTSTTCAGLMPDSVSVIINTLPVSYSVISRGSAYCAGGAGIDLSLTGSQTGVNYQLYNGTVASGGMMSGTGAIIDFGNRTASGSYTVVGVNMATGCAGNMPGSAFISINSLPTAYTIDGGGSYCSGGTGVHIGLANSNSGINYQLYRAGVATGTAVAGTGVLIDLGLQSLTGTYTVVATNSVTGCQNNMSGAVNVSINALPAVYNVTGGGSFCAGSTGVHVGLSGSAIGINYQLYTGGALMHSTTGTGLPIDFGVETTAGSYTVTAVNTATGCTSNMSANAVVVVNALPVLYRVSGGGSFCQGSTGVDVSLSGSNTGVSYSLYKDGAIDGGAISGSGTTVDLGIQTVAGTYTVKATDRVTSCMTNMTGGAVVVVNPLPVVYPVEGGGSYCAGGAGVHVGMSSSQTGVSYQLYNGSSVSGSPVPGTGGILDLGVQTSAGTYRVIATNSTTTCGSNMNDSAVVTVIAPVAPFVSISTGQGDTVCRGSLITFTAMPVNGGGAPSYIWAINGVNVTTGGLYSYLPNDGDVVSVAMTSAAACASPAIATTNIEITVESNGIPAIAVTAAPGNRVCQGTMVNYTSNVTNGGPVPSYAWMKNGTVVGTAATYSYTPVTGDNISCVLTSDYHCRITNTTSSNHITMTVDTAIAPTVMISADPGLDIAYGQTLTLSATILDGGPSPYIQWYVNSQAIAGASALTFSGNTFGNLDNVTCKVISNGGCAGIAGEGSVTIHITNVGVKQVTVSNSDVQLLPNPNKGAFTLKGTIGNSAMNDNDVQMEITNMLGQSVYSKNITVHNGAINEQVQMSNVPANGMYILTLHSDVVSKVFHMVIER